MYPSIKRTAVSLCLAASIAAPVWASQAASTTEPNVILAPVAAMETKVPSQVTVDGKTVTFDQGPVMVDGVLFVPVRAIAEAAGGVVTWDDAIRLTHVRMPERTIMIRYEHQEAEMHKDGVYYLTRNLVQMKKMPVLMGGRTLMSADALTNIFGFQATATDDGTLALTSPSQPANPAAAPEEPAAPAADVERGTVSRWESDDHKRFLLAGAPMANGEPTLSWVAITETTKITVQEGEQTRAGSVSDIKDGAQVAVTWAGPRAMSYPSQGAAAEVVVTASKAAAPEEPAAPEAPAADVERGTVSQVEAGDHPRFLLTGASMANGEPTLSWVAITETTKITVQEGDQTRPGSVSDIKDGAQVAVTWTGPRIMSYPSQGAAAEIVVLSNTSVAPEPPAADVDRGTVSRLEAGDLPRFLLTGAPMANGEPTLNWVIITEKTKIIVREGDQTHAGSVSEIKDGAQVTVTWTGPRIMSYPSQGAAAEIVVHK